MLLHILPPEPHGLYSCNRLREHYRLAGQDPAGADQRVFPEIGGLPDEEEDEQAFNRLHDRVPYDNGLKVLQPVEKPGDVEESREHIERLYQVDNKIIPADDKRNTEVHRKGYQRYDNMCKKKAPEDFAELFVIISVLGNNALPMPRYPEHGKHHKVVGDRIRVSIDAQRIAAQSAREERRNDQRNDKRHPLIQKLHDQIARKLLFLQ